MNNFCIKYAHHLYFCGLQKLNTLNLRHSHPPLNPRNHFSTVLIKTNWYTISCKYRGCSGLTSITIPNSVTSLGGYCFDCCLGLTEVHANRETPPATGYGIFNTCNSLQTIYVPTGASANYDIDPWNAYKIVEEDVLSGITAVTVKGETVAPVYHLNGSRAGTTKSFSTQPKGIYIMNGKKVLR